MVSEVKAYNGVMIHIRYNDFDLLMKFLHTKIFKCQSVLFMSFTFEIYIEERAKEIVQTKNLVV